MIPRRPDLHGFDTVGMALVSKAFFLARACIMLLEADFEDEALGLCRSIVECGWTLRFLTQVPEKVEERTRRYVDFILSDKQFWAHYALRNTQDEETKVAIRDRATEMHLRNDATEVVEHWSGNRGFAWYINQGDHPLDGPKENQLSKSSEYAVNYHQASSYVHCFAPAIENFLPCKATPFRVKLDDGEGGRPSQLVLYCVATYLHACIAYMFFGLCLERPGRLNELISELISNQLRAVPSGSCDRRERRRHWKSFRNCSLGSPGRN